MGKLIEEGALELLYAKAPFGTYLENNKWILEILAAENGLPINLPEGWPDHTKLDRKLTIAGIYNDMENRRIITVNNWLKRRYGIKETKD